MNDPMINPRRGIHNIPIRPTGAMGFGLPREAFYGRQKLEGRTAGVDPYIRVECRLEKEGSAAEAPSVGRHGMQERGECCYESNPNVESRNCQPDCNGRNRGD